MNSSLNWNLSGPASSSQMDFYSVAIHEFGHWLSLNDDYDHSDPLMHAYLGYGEVKTDLHYEDIDAAQNMY